MTGGSLCLYWTTSEFGVFIESYANSMDREKSNVRRKGKFEENILVRPCHGHPASHTAHTFL